MGNERGRQTAQSPQRGGADAFYDRGNALQRAQHFAEAVASYDQALAIRPEWVEALTNRGVALRILGRTEDAVASYDRALAVRPTFALALANRGNALRDLGRHQQALASYDRALVIQPAYPDALNNRGVALQDLGRYADALESFDRSLALRPGHAETLIGRANALCALRRPDDALESCARALAAIPGHPEALNTRGNALCDLGRPQEALESYSRALATLPDHAGALYNRANVLQMLRRAEEALADYGRALALRPSNPDILSNRGNALLTLRRDREAAEDFDRALQIDPDYPYALGKLLHARQRCCDWTAYRQHMTQMTEGVAADKRVSMPFEFAVTSESSEDQLRCARLWLADQCPSDTPPLWQGPRGRHDRIRLAYLSADFHEHATAYLMAGLFEQHDRTRFETFAISYGPDSGSAMRARLVAAFGRFIDVRSRTDAEVAALLRELEVDIAVDLKGFTGESRPAILSSRPAPVQVNYLGYPGTMGADFIDYIVADRIVIPDEQRTSYSEKVVTLPGCYAVNDSHRTIAERTPTRAELGLPESGFVFCSFNNSYKITPDVFDIWMRLLLKVEGSVLWLLASDECAAANLRREAEARSIQPGRLVFAPRVRLEDHLARHRCADLFFDTLPCNAHTTASDALWAGLPLVTCLGSTFAGRVAVSLLNAVGLPELVTRSLPDYEALALKLARDDVALASIKAKLAANRLSCPLFDTGRFRRHIEAAFSAMWERHQMGQPPEAFVVPPYPDADRLPM